MVFSFDFSASEIFLVLMRLAPLGRVALLCIYTLPQSFCTIIGQKRDRSTMEGEADAELLPDPLVVPVPDIACTKLMYISPCPSEVSATNCLRGQLEMLRLFKESNYAYFPILTKIYRRLLGSAEPILDWSTDEIIRFEESTLGSFRMQDSDLETMWEYFETLVDWGPEADEDAADFLEEMDSSHSVSEWREWFDDTESLVDSRVEFSPALIKSVTDKRIQCLASVVAQGESVMNQVELYVNSPVDERDRAFLHRKAFDRLDGENLTHEENIQLNLRKATLLRKLVSVKIPEDIIVFLSQFRTSDDPGAVNHAMNKFIRNLIFVQGMDHVILNNLADCFHIFLNGTFIDETLPVARLASILNTIALTGVSARDMGAIWQVRQETRFTSRLSADQFLEIIRDQLSLVLDDLPPTTIIRQSIFD